MLKFLVALAISALIIGLGERQERRQRGNPEDGYENLSELAAHSEKHRQEESE